MDKIELFNALIEEINWEITQLDPGLKNDKLKISDLKAQRSKYTKYIEQLKLLESED